LEDLELLEELEDQVDVIEGLQVLAEAQEQGSGLPNRSTP